MEYSAVNDAGKNYNAEGSAMSVVAFDFYDGATEGLVRSVFGSGPCYFKLIAWDDDQDQRLYGVTCIDEPAFQTIVAQALLASPSLTSSVLLLRITPGSIANDDNLDRLVEYWIENIVRSGFLICGRAVDSADAKRYNVPEVMKSRLKEVMGANEPESLAHWQPHLIKR